MTIMISIRTMAARMTMKAKFHSATKITLNRKYSPIHPFIPRNQSPFSTSIDGLAYLVGPHHPPLIDHSLPQYWSSHILPLHHHRIALISKDEPPSKTSIDQTLPPSSSSIDPCLRLTYSQLDHSINSIASSLYHQLGIRKGDRVGINTSNHSIYPILQWATAKIGAILATINPAYSSYELINAINKVDCKVLFSTPSFKTKDMIPMLAELITQDITTRPTQIGINNTNMEGLKTLVIVDNESNQKIPSSSIQARRIRSKPEIFHQLRNSIDLINHNHQDPNHSTSDKHINILDLDQLLLNKPNPKTLDNQSIHSQDIINLQFTSGTTGFPKAVSLTHRNLLNNAFHISQRLNLTSNDLVCNVPPMFHCFGSVIGNLASFLAGSSLVIPSQTFDPKRVIKTIHEERCTVLHGVGTMFLAEINELDRLNNHHDQVYDLSCLRTGVIAGSPVSDELMNQIEDRLGLKELTILYGMTETSPGSFQTSPTDDRLKQTTTVGKIFPHTEAKIVDLNTREIVKIDERGELWVSGYSVQKGYWNDPIETDKVLIKDHSGRIWMKSGDIASVDSNGYLKIVGRAKDVIIRGGENLYPVVIENCIIKLEGVEDVAVVSVPDKFYGETVGAFIKRRGIKKNNQVQNHDKDKDDVHSSINQNDVQNFVRTHLASANIPKHVWFLDSINRSDFPLTASGKIKKNELIEWVKDLMPSQS